MISPINPQSAVTDLVEFWLERLRAEKRLANTTVNEYERVCAISSSPASAP